MVLDRIITSIRFVDGSESIIEVSAKTAEYFGIREIAPKTVSIQKRAYSYYRREGLTSERSKVINVPSSKYTRVPRLGAKSVREVRVPTELITPRGNVRTHGIKFPTKADYIDISHWLWWRCTRNKPEYFITEAGKKRGIFDWSNGETP
jgi:hypothetical protein